MNLLWKEPFAGAVNSDRACDFENETERSFIKTFKNNTKKAIGLKFRITSNGLKLDLESLLKSDVLTNQIKAMDENKK